MTKIIFFRNKFTPVSNLHSYCHFYRLDFFWGKSAMFWKPCKIYFYKYTKLRVGGVWGSKSNIMKYGQFGQHWIRGGWGSKKVKNVGHHLWTFPSIDNIHRIQFTFFALKTNAKSTDLDFANVKLLITMQWQKYELLIDIYVQQHWCSINTAFDIKYKLSFISFAEIRYLEKICPFLMTQQIVHRTFTLVQTFTMLSSNNYVS